MTKYFFTFLFRSLLNNKFFALINITGLALGFAGFILAYQYINRERSYDQWNPNYEYIYRIGLTYQGNYSPITPPSLAKTIKSQLPEIEQAGLILDYSYSNYPMFGKESVNVRKTLLIDSGAAKIFQIESMTGPLYKSTGQQEASLVSEELGKRLFGKEYLDFSAPKNVSVLSIHHGFKEKIYGIGKDRALSLIDYDLLLIKEIDSEQQGNPYNYHTYIQAKPGTNISLLADKITKIYQEQTAQEGLIKHSSFAKGKIYLDPLSNLHLRPKDGSNGPYLTLWILGILSALTLVLSAINFANLTMAQADSRAKEIGIKKMFGSSRSSITLQLLGEILTQCLLAACVAGLVLLLTGNMLKTWLNEDLIDYLFHTTTLLQLLSAICVTSIIAGFYPAVILAGYKIGTTIKGKLQTNPKRVYLRNSLLAFQFFIAFSFICGALLVYQQMQFVKETDKGFSTDQVINFKGVGLYYDMKPDGTFYDFKRRLTQSPNIVSVSSATNIPAGADAPPKKHFTYQNQTIELDHIGIDIGYFETLDIADVAGAGEISLDQLLKDSTENYAVINETAAKELGIRSPFGVKITGCETDFTVTAIVKDIIAYGFENKIAPTVYSYKNECGPGRYKTSVIVKTKAGKTKEAIQAVKEEWIKNPSAESLPLDYEFLDLAYAQLHAKQSQLEILLNGFTMLSLFIAMLGIFSVSAYDIVVRNKEISIRKILGATTKDILFHLNKTYIYILVTASVLGIPIAYFLMKDWLNNFAYKVSITPWIFILSIGVIAFILTIIVSFQSLKAARSNPIDALRDE
ncbi:MULTISPECIES: ABC transporter permease [Sphingobacterium]|uniref:ABC transporter permease n=1 Tax=Sphingobacterium TaxID=28453 RepID=UPI0013DB2213|nr:MULTISPECIES: FtsX-like permease family protein [unclassified Sphingobacterium]